MKNNNNRQLGLSLEEIDRFTSNQRKGSRKGTEEVTSRFCCNFGVKEDSQLPNQQPNQRFIDEKSGKEQIVKSSACSNIEVSSTSQVQNAFPKESLSYLHYKKKRTFFKECAVAGWNFYIEKDFWPELEKGTQLVLIRDKNNKNDRHAVAVMLENDFDGDWKNVDMDFIIGYVPRTENETIAQMMDMGWFDVFTAELTTVKKHGTNNERLRMTIYIQSKEEVQVDDNPEDKLFGMTLDDEGFQKLENSLHYRGSVYYRWGGFPVWKRFLPEEKNKVLVVYRREKDAQLYLMYVLAIDVKATPFLDNPEDELNIEDDCCPYVLTNVKGPITTSLQDLAFLDNEPISDRQPNGYLSDWATNQLNTLFANSTRHRY